MNWKPIETYVPLEDGKSEQIIVGYYSPFTKGIIADALYTRRHEAGRGMNFFDLSGAIFQRPQFWLCRTGDIEE